MANESRSAPPGSWRARLKAASPADARPAFRPGVSIARIERAAQRIALDIPSDLAALLQETDGVTEQRKVHGAWQDARPLVWTVDQIEEINADADDDTEGPWHLLFAAGADGTMYAFAVDDSGEEDPSVYAYAPASESWTRVAASLDEHLRGWPN